MNTDSRRDAEGYLFQPEDWDETLASKIAKRVDSWEKVTLAI